MNEVWVLTVKTSLPNVCESPCDLKTITNIFSSFEKGREAFRTVVRKYAFTENSMFDGNGNIVYFQEYISRAWVNEDDDQGDNIYMLEKKHFEFIAEALRSVFSSNDIDFKLPYEECDDGMLGVSYDGDELSIYGTEDGPINGYNPQIQTNIFSMEEEKEYYLYINDIFAQNISSELYIDLTKSEIQ